MSDKPNPDILDVSTQSNSDISSLLKKMQQQLDALEKKIDTLMARPLEKSFGEKRFSKPFRPYDRSTRQGQGSRDYGSRERSYGSGERSYGSRERSYGPGRTFDKPAFEKPSFEKRSGDDQRSSFSPKKKPFFNKRRER